MPNFRLSQQPKYPLVFIDSDELITATQLAVHFTDQSGIMLCVRSKNGHPKRGGYFFCIRQTDSDRYNLETMEGSLVAEAFSLDKLVDFINHASGKQFHADILAYCQNTANFRTD